MKTLDELKKLLHDKFEIEPATLDPNVPLVEYGLDSLSIAELLFTVEDYFHLEFPDARADVNTLGGLAHLIDDLRPAMAA